MTPSTTTPGYTLFDTSLGRCGLAWSERGVVALQLPEATPEEVEARLSRYGSHAHPPAAIRALVERVQRHLAGDLDSFTDVTLDLDGTGTFARAVYDHARTLAPGDTCSYGELAAAIGRPGAARAVGQALGRNPLSVIVPCHRILAHGGRPGGFSAYGGFEVKRRLLALEGVVLPDRAAPGLPQRPKSLFDGDALARAVAALRRRDARLRRIIDQVGPCTLGAGRVQEKQASKSCFGALCEAILYQQLAGSAAAAIAARFRGLFGDRYPTPSELHGSDEGAIRGVGVSGGKLATLKTLAAAVVEGRLDMDAIAEHTDAEVFSELTALRGIGRWTADMFLIFQLGRPDIWPVGDLAIRKAVGRLLGREEIPPAAEVESAGDRWRPYRTIATWYLWSSQGTVTID